MSAYIIVDVTVLNKDEYEGYKKLTPGSLAAYGGKFIVRGGSTECLEGDWNPERIVVLQFESVTRAKEWWSSAEYAPAKKIRQLNAKTKMILVEGVSL
ncbi:MAG: DUF1330 domain-containing protein [Chryseolinea sp.]